MKKALQYSPTNVEQWHGMEMQPLVSMLVEHGLRIIPLAGLLMQTLLLVSMTITQYGQIWYTS